jgi:hypothetical protein
VQTLLYPAIRRVQHVLETAPFEDLVAVFTYAESEGGLLAYQADTAPSIPSDIERNGWRSATLASLRPPDYAACDGPVVGLDAVDLVLPYVPVHGVNFRALERLPLDRNRRAILRRTAWRLAEFLRSHSPLSEEDKRRFRRKIMSLCLPTWLSEYPRDDLVALQGDDVLGPSTARPRPFYNHPGQPDDLKTLDASAAWTIGLQEINLLAPDPVNGTANMIEIRPALRRIGCADALARTCRNLAQRCWQAWQRTEQSPLREAAYSLAAESWLVDEEADDLIAVVPEGDFDSFVSEGRFYRVYRYPPPPVQASERICALEDMLAGRVALPGADTPVLALPILQATLQQMGVNEVINLGRVLWNAGCQKALARTFWLLSRDLLDPPAPALRRRLQSTPEAISELARRAALMYSIDDPWGWRQGRYDDLLLHVYAHVDRCLEYQQRAAQSPLLASYFGGLRAWYGCATAEDVMEQLARAVDMLRTFASEAENSLEERYVRSAQRLIQVGEQMLHPDALPLPRDDSYFSGFSSALAPGAISALLRDAAMGIGPAAEPSSLLEISVTAYRSCHEEWRRYRMEVLQQRPDPQRLDLLRERFMGLRRGIHAPWHEQRMLKQVLDMELGQISSLRQALVGGPVIEILARGQEVTLETRQSLIFEVRNDGNQTARDLELTLQSSLGLEMLTSDTTIALPSLQPGERQRFEYQARALQPMLTLIFAYRFRDEEDRFRRGEKRVLITVTRAASGPRFRVNPFEVGRPVSGAGVAFFGRQEELSKILSRLARPEGTQPLALRGPRRIGKSSLLREIEAVLERPGEEGRALNLAPETLGGLANVRAVFASLQRMGGSDEAAFVPFLRGLLRDIAQKLGIEPGPIETAFDQQRDPHTSVRAFSEQVDRILEQRPELRLVALLDELDWLFQPEAFVIAGQLRSIIETKRKISWITTSTRLVRSAVGMQGSPWFNLLEIFPLHAMDWASATQLVRQLGGRAGCEWGPEAVTALLEATGQRPYLIQLLGARVTDALNAAGRDLVQIADVTTAINRLLDEATTTGSYLGYVWHEAGPLGQLILWAVSESKGSTGQADILRAIRQAAGRYGLMLDRATLDSSFDERISWLTEIADALELRSGGYTFAFPLIERLVRGKLGRSEDLVGQLLQNMSQPSKDRL